MTYTPPPPPGSLFAQPEIDRPTPTALPPRDPNARPGDIERLSGQNAAILARLRTGPATNTELAGLALKYTSRISDLRACGYVIQADARFPGDNGVVTYRLVSGGTT